MRICRGWPPTWVLRATATFRRRSTGGLGSRPAPIAPGSTKSHRAYRSIPVADLGGVGLVHIEEVGHGRSRNRLALVIRCHRDDTTKDLERAAIPVFKHVVMGGEPRVNKRAQVLPDGIAPVPVSNAKVADGVLRKAVEPFAEGLVIDLFPEGQQPIRRRGFAEGLSGHNSISRVLIERACCAT